MPDFTLPDEINVRSEGYFIARTVAACAHCRAPTRLLALALPPEHETLAMDADAESEESAHDTWEVASGPAFLFSIEYLAPLVECRLREHSAFFRYAYSEATQGSQWLNHCESCGSRLDDHELFCEPGGAFLPTDHASAAAIQLVWIDETLEAAAAGYACEPEFFASMGGT